MISIVYLNITDLYFIGQSVTIPYDTNSGDNLMGRNLLFFIAVVLLGACNSDDATTSTAIIGVATPSSVSVVPAN